MASEYEIARAQLVAEYDQEYAELRHWFVNLPGPTRLWLNRAMDGSTDEGANACIRRLARAMYAQLIIECMPIIESSSD